MSDNLFEEFIRKSDSVGFVSFDITKDDKNKIREVVINDFNEKFSNLFFLENQSILSRLLSMSEIENNSKLKPVLKLCAQAFDNYEKGVKDFEYVIEKFSIITKVEINSFANNSIGLLITNISVKNRFFSSYYNDILETQDEFVVRVDLNNKFTYVNASYCKAFGKKRKDLLGNSFAPLVHEDYIENTLNEMKKIFNPPYKAYMEQKAKTVDGWRWIAWHDTAIFDDSGEILEIQGVGRDITETKENAQSVSDNRDFLKTLINAIPAPVFYKDSNGKYLGVNKEFENFFGKSSDDIVGKTVYDLSPKEYADVYYIKDCQLYTQKGVQQYDAQVKNANGDIRDVVFYKSLFFNNNNEIAGIIGTILDVTENKKVEESLNIERNLFSQGPVFTIIWDKISNCNIEFVSKNVENILGYTQKEMQSQNFSYEEIIHPDDIQKIADEFNLKIKEGASFIEQSYRLKMKNGDYRWFYDYTMLVKDEFGKIASLRGYLIDITEDKNKELLIEKQNSELIVAKEKAEKASLAKSEFLSNMSHEIRTPLNAIIGFIDLLKHSQTDNVQKEYLDNITVSADSLLDIINDVLDLSKIEAGKLDLEPEFTNIYDIIDSCAGIVKHLANEKEIEFIVNCSPNLPDFIKTDSVRLKQIIVNLLGNAVKFTNHGEVEFIIEFKNISDKRGIYTFFVRDTGIGIGESEKNKLFKAFSQGDSSTTKKFGGTGLGLVISNALAEKMNSKIEFETEVDKGSMFHFTIEAEFENRNRALIIDENKTVKAVLSHLLKKANIEVVACSKYEIKHRLFKPIKNRQFYQTLIEKDKYLSGDIIDETPSYEDKPPNKTLDKEKMENLLKILIVEDVAINIKLIRTMIEKFFNKVLLEEARNGAEALEKYKIFNPHIVIMDIQMPIMDGVDATVQIRRYEEFTKDKSIIIALTAGVEREEKDRCFKAGMDDFLSKPVKFEDLETVLNKYKNCVKTQIASDEKSIAGLNKQIISFDKNELIKRFNNNTKVVNTILQKAPKQFEIYIKTLRDALNKRDYSLIRDTAHTLKGAAATICFSKLSVYAARIQKFQSLEIKEIKEIKDLINAIEREWDIIKKIL